MALYSASRRPAELPPLFGRSKAPAVAEESAGGRIAAAPTILILRCYYAKQQRRGQREHRKPLTSTWCQTKRPPAARSRQSIWRLILNPADGAACKTECCVGLNVMTRRRGREMILFPGCKCCGG